MDSRDSVLSLVERLQADDTPARDLAAQELWDRYSGQLRALAQRRLGDVRLRRRIDPDDILQSAYASLCIRLARGEYDVGGREDFEALVRTITFRKAVSTIKKHRCQARDYRREEFPASRTESDTSHPHFPSAESTDPTPLEEALAREESEVASSIVSRLMSMVERQSDPNLLKVILLKIIGYSTGDLYSHREIGEELGISERTVDRKWAIIKLLLEPLREEWGGTWDDL